MDSLNDIWHYAPHKWDKPYGDNTFRLNAGTVEYDDVEYDISKAVNNLKEVRSICRVQNILNFGQFLMRSQILARANSTTPYYKVRRYIAIPTHLKKIALKYNLDHRRLGMDQFEFCSHLYHVNNGHSIFVVVILTDDNCNRCISPYNFTDYFIDYVVDIDVF